MTDQPETDKKDKAEPDVEKAPMKEPEAPKEQKAPEEKKEQKEQKEQKASRPEKTSNVQTDKQDKQLEEAFNQLESNQRQDASRGSNVPAILALLIALVALGVASYAAFEQYRQGQQSGSDLEQTLARQQQALDAADRRVAALEQQLANTNLDAIQSQLDNMSSSSASMAQRNAEVDQALTGLREDLAALGKTSSKEWVHAEIEYLVRMAAQRVLMEQDAESALQLLRAADELVKTTEGLTAHQLREALAHDIAALEGVAAVDTQGIYLALSALAAQVPNLKRGLPEFEPAPLPEAAAPEGGWLGVLTANLDRALGRLASLVDFRRDQVKVKPILPPTEAYFLRQNLVLKLQVAQMAVLEGNQEVYQAALDEAITWTSEGFDESDAATAALLTRLDSLAGEQVAVALPDISRSLQAARRTLGQFGEVDQP